MTKVQMYRLEETKGGGPSVSPAFSLTYLSTRLPSLSCWGVPGSCGNVWASPSERVRQELPNDHPLANKRMVEPVQPAVFEEVVTDVQRYIDAPREALTPGTPIGTLRLNRCHNKVLDFERVSTRTRLITEEVRKFFADNAFTGWNAYPVRLLPEADSTYSTLTVHELSVPGRGTLTLDKPPAITFQCNVCGYRKLDWTVVKSIVPDEASVEGLDFFKLPLPYVGGIYVSERVKWALYDSGLINWDLTPIDDCIQTFFKKVGTR